MEAKLTGSAVGLPRMVAEASLLAVQFRTLFVLTNCGRIERENDPDHSPGPRLWLAGCVSGNVIGLRSDISDTVAAEIATIAATEPPFIDRNAPPKHLDRYVGLLSRDAPVARQSLGRIYELPHHLKYAHRVRLISDDSHAGRHFHAHLSADGMPDELAELGFRSLSDLWPPWCVALVDGKAASVAFAARIAETGAELGVATAKAFRGQGYAAAAIAGWSASPALQSRALFYSTDRINVSSQRVVARVGLRFVGASLRLS